MELNRREVLAGAALLAAGCGGSRKVAPPATGWAAVRAQFALGPGRHFDAFLFAAHPQPVREAIEHHRAGLDAGAAGYLHEHEIKLDEAVATWCRRRPAAVRHPRRRHPQVAVGSTRDGDRVDAGVGPAGPHDPHVHARRLPLVRAPLGARGGVRLPGGAGAREGRRADHLLATRLKNGLASLDNVRLVTPRSPEVSAGIVCFEVSGSDANGVVSALAAHGIRASVTPYATQYARLGTSLHVDEHDVDAALERVAGL